MDQAERRIFLIKRLLAEQPEYSDMEISQNEQEQKRLLPSLFNIRMPRPAGREFLQIQDDYLQEELNRKCITDYKSLKPIQKGVYLWKGDITTLRCGAIVNAANSQMLGCFPPCHGCIDNAIHTFAGIQLRAACAELMKKQGHDEKTGHAKITPAFNLPCEYVLHTVGPIVQGTLTLEDRVLLTSCYRSCLELAEQNHIGSIAFCCLSTGEFHFPNSRAAEIAVSTVREYIGQPQCKMEVIYNVFKDSDYGIYRELLGAG